jgi:hypothetical protein
MLNMNSKRLSDAQYAFLRDVRDGTLSLKEHQEKHKLDGKRFSRWMCGIGFRRQLTRVMRVSSRLRRLRLLLAANLAAEQLAEAVRKGEALSEAMQAQLERTINQGRKEQQMARAEQRSRGLGGGGGRWGKRLPAEDEDLCHPNAKAREDELLAILEGGAGGES